MNKLILASAMFLMLGCATQTKVVDGGAGARTPASVLATSACLFDTTPETINTQAQALATQFGLTPKQYSVSTVACIVGSKTGRQIEINGRKDIYYVRERLPNGSYCSHEISIDPDGNEHRSEACYPEMVKCKIFDAHNAKMVVGYGLGNSANGPCQPTNCNVGYVIENGACVKAQ